MAHARILIITLYSGENEIVQQSTSIRKQSIQTIKRTIISGLTKFEAHSRMREIIAISSQEFDIFIKLDADMVFRSENSLRLLCRPFSDNPNLYHLVAPVFDVPSQQNIYGVHLFRSGVYWSKYHDKLFTDTNPTIPGVRVLLPLATDPHVDHMPDPSMEQAFMFGVHRASKIVQRDRIVKECRNARFQIDLLRKIATAANGNEDHLRGAILKGAEQVLKSKDNCVDYKNVDIPESVLLGGSNGRPNGYSVSWDEKQWRYYYLIFRFSILPLTWSYPIRILNRYGYLLYVKSGIRKAVRRNRMKR